MTATEILERIQRHPGAMLPITIESPIESLKGHRDVTVVKRSYMYVTAGTEFANRRDVREAIAAGERGEVGPLPWGEWVKYPFIIGHTPKKGPYAGQYTHYVRLFPPTQEQLAHFNLAPRVAFYANGIPITREQAKLYCGAKAEEEESKRDVFAVAAPNIVNI